MNQDFYRKIQQKGKKDVKAIFQYHDKKENKWKSKTHDCKDQSTQKKNERDANTWLDTQVELYEQNNGSFDKEKITFRQFVEKKTDTHFHQAIWDGDIKISGYDSWDDVRKHEMNALLDYFGDMRLKGIEQDDIDQFRAKRFRTKTKAKKQRSLGAVNRECQLLRRVFTLAFDDKIIRERFNFSINNSDEPSRSRVLKPDEETRLMIELEKPEFARYKPMFIVLLNTGLRIGECKNITWEMVKNLEQPERCHFALTARATKTKKKRIVPFSPIVREIILELLENKQSDDDTVFDTTNYKNDVKEIFKNAEIKDFWARDTKHCAVTNMAKADVPRHLIRKIIGTETDKLLDKVYINLELEDLTDGYQKFVDYRNRPIETTESGFIN